MISISNLATQTIAAGQTVTFDRLLFKSGCNECYNNMIPSSIKMCAKGVYDITFNGNISAGTAGDALQLAIAIEGTPIPTTVMDSTPGTADTLNNVSARVRIRNTCCDLGRITVMNSGTTPVTLAPNSVLNVERRG